MRFLPTLFLALFAVGCSGKTTPPGTTPTPTGDSTAPTTDTTDTQTSSGACGAQSLWDLTVTGSVRTPNHQPAVGASLTLEERVFNPSPKVYGTATTDAYGDFQLTASQVLSIDRCWGILLDYHLVATLDPGSADVSVNQPLYNAITDSSLVADLVPIDLEKSGSGL